MGALDSIKSPVFFGEAADEVQLGIRICPVQEGFMLKNRGGGASVSPYATKARGLLPEMDATQSCLLLNSALTSGQLLNL